MPARMILAMLVALSFLTACAQESWESYNNAGVEAKVEPMRKVCDLVSTRPKNSVPINRFLMIKAAAEDQQAQINVVLNWFEELKRLVPTDN